MGSPVRFRLPPWVGQYNDNIPANVHFEDNACDQGTCKAGLYPWLENGLGSGGETDVGDHRHIKSM
jgi:hypothetical protein